MHKTLTQQEMKSSLLKAPISPHWVKPLLRLHLPLQLLKHLQQRL